MKHDQEPITEPLPHRHPNEAFSSEALRQRMAAAAMEKVSGFDVNETSAIPVRDASVEATDIPVVPRAYTDAELAELRGSEVRARAKARSNAWIRKVQ